MEATQEEETESMHQEQICSVEEGKKDVEASTNIVSLKVEEAQANERLDKYLSQALHLSRRVVATLIEERKVKVNNSTAIKSHYKIKMNDAIEVEKPEEENFDHLENEENDSSENIEDNSKPPVQDLGRKRGRKRRNMPNTRKMMDKQGKRDAKGRKGKSAQNQGSGWTISDRVYEEILSDDPTTTTNATTTTPVKLPHEKQGGEALHEEGGGFVNPDELDSFSRSRITDKVIRDGYVVIDGSYLEGGGQILRNTVALSGILGMPIQVQNIRGGRTVSGLLSQHSTGVCLLEQLYSAKVTGKEISSCELKFRPKEFCAGKYTADAKTAGSICLLMQIALPCLLFGSKETPVVLKGGTNVAFAPQIDYILHVFRPIAKRMGIGLHVEINRRGYFPTGGGEVLLKARPVLELNPIDLAERGEIKTVYCRTFVSGSINLGVGQRLATHTEKILRKFFGKDETEASATEQSEHKERGTKEKEKRKTQGKEKEEVEFKMDLVKEDRASGNGVGVIIVATSTTGCILGASALGGRGVTVEKVAKEATKKLIFNWRRGGCVDEYLQDQLILYCALANGKSTLRIGPLTKHTLTAIHFVQMMTGANFEIHATTDRKSPEETTYLLTCEGIGFKNKYLVP